MIYLPSPGTNLKAFPIMGNGLGPGISSYGFAVLNSSDTDRVVAEVTFLFERNAAVALRRALCRSAGTCRAQPVDTRPNISLTLNFSGIYFLILICFLTCEIAMLL